MEDETGMIRFRLCLLRSPCRKLPSLLKDV